LTLQLPLDASDVRFAHVSDRGRVRRDNEDWAAAFAPEDPVQLRTYGRLFVVADGVGGTRAGGIASRLAVAAIRDRFYAGRHPETAAEALTESVKAANAVLFQTSRRDGAVSTLETTLTALVLRDGEATVGHVGDSRAYLVRGGLIRQVTEDHSLVGALVRKGVMGPADAVNHPQAHVILRAVGTAREVAVDIHGPMPLRAGDAWVLCTDGLSRLVTPSEIGRLAWTQPPHQACVRLVALAQARGGPDNITVQVVRVGGRDRTISRTMALTTALARRAWTILTSARTPPLPKQGGVTGVSAAMRSAQRSR
jgi:PPM family protein phosphatase